MEQNLLLRKELFSPSFKVSAQDTTGAGDSFIDHYYIKWQKVNIH